MTRALLTLANDKVRERAIQMIKDAPQMARVEIKDARRSLDQNSKLWAAIADIAAQYEHMGRKYNSQEWKILLMHAWGREVQFVPSLDGKTFVPFTYSSSDLTKAEMSDLLEFIISWGAQNGIKFNDRFEREAA